LFVLQSTSYTRYNIPTCTDNVGDVAGMGADLFGSFAESTCAALVIGSSIGVSGGWNALMFPLVVSAVGLFVCLLCSFIATHIRPVKKEADVENALKLQLISTTILMIPSIYYTAHYFLPASFEIAKTVGKHTLMLTPTKAAMCVAMGAVGGLVIGLVTEYYTSHSYAPVREDLRNCFGIQVGHYSSRCLGGCRLRHVYSL
jgi:Na+/H+-translocating membrane pyrophosphatase